MKIVIDIPDSFYPIMMNASNSDCVSKEELLNCLRNGTPYNPSGDLISREAMKEAIDLLFEHGGYDSGLVMNTIDNVPSVIPADK